MALFIGETPEYYSVLNGNETLKIPKFGLSGEIQQQILSLPKAPAALPVPQVAAGIQAPREPTTDPKQYFDIPQAAVPTAGQQIASGAGRLAGMIGMAGGVPEGGGGLQLSGGPAASGGNLAIPELEGMSFGTPRLSLEPQFMPQVTPSVPGAGMGALGTPALTPPTMPSEWQSFGGTGAGGIGQVAGAALLGGALKPDTGQTYKPTAEASGITGQVAQPSVLDFAGQEGTGAFNVEMPNAEEAKRYPSIAAGMPEVVTPPRYMPPAADKASDVTKDMISNYNFAGQEGTGEFIVGQPNISQLGTQKWSEEKQTLEPGLQRPAPNTDLTTLHSPEQMKYREELRKADMQSAVDNRNDVKRLNEELKKTEDELNNKKLEPWSDKSFGERMGIGLAFALAAVGQGIAQRDPSVVMSQFLGAMNQDIEKQKGQIASKKESARNAYKRAMDIVGDQRQAELLTKSWMLEDLNMQTQDLMFRVGREDQKQTIAQFNATLQETKRQHNQQFGLGLLNAQNNEKQLNMMENRYKAEAEAKAAKEREIPATLVKDLGSMMASKTGIEELFKSFNRVGVEVYAGSSIIPFFHTEAKTHNLKRTAMAQQLNKAINGGRASDQDFAKIMEYMPDASDTKAFAAEKKKNLIEYAMKQQAGLLTSAEYAKYPVDKYNEDFTNAWGITPQDFLARQYADVGITPPPSRTMSKPKSFKTY